MLKMKYLIANLATNTTVNVKTNVVKNEIHSITNLAATTAFTAVENKMPNVNNLVKSDWSTKFNKIEDKFTTDHNHDKYITTQEFNKLISENFTVRLAQGYFAKKGRYW